MNLEIILAYIGPAWGLLGPCWRWSGPYSSG